MRINRAGLFLLFVLLVGLGVISSTSLRAATSAERASAPNHEIPLLDRTVIGPRNWASAAQHAEIKAIKAYDQYVLYTLSDEVYAALSAAEKAALDPQSGQNQLSLSIGTLVLNTDHRLEEQNRLDRNGDQKKFEAISDPTELESRRLGSGTTSGLLLVQFQGPIQTEWLNQLEAAGAVLLQYVAHNGYLIWVEPDNEAAVMGQIENSPTIRYGTDYGYRFEAKLDRRLSDTLRAQRIGANLESAETAGTADALERDQKPITLTIQMAPHQKSGQTKAHIDGYAQETLSPWREWLGIEMAIIRATPAAGRQIAALGPVIWVEQQPIFEPFDEAQNQILTGNWNADGTAPVDPNYIDWLLARGFSQSAADYPIVDITDSGLGTGALDSGDPTLHDFGDLNGPTRIQFINNCTAETNGGDVGGHGHINVSIVGGYDQRDGTGFNDADGFNYGLGVNPFTRLAATRIFGPSRADFSNCNDDLGVMLARTVQSGAKIVNNSWGCLNCGGVYDTSSQLYDGAIRDADAGTPGSQQLTAIFAAGNYQESCVDPQVEGTLNSPANAKNVITVGATENVRPQFTDGCGHAPAAADSLQDIACFSGRGPAVGDRIKPEIMAPGTHVVGTLSTNPAFQGGGVCNSDFPEAGFAVSTGTSHAAPAIAGAASLADYWLRTQFDMADPSPALIKAYLLAHTTHLTGESGNDTLPSNNQGFGLADLGAAFDDSERYLIDQSIVLDESGESWTFSATVADPTRPVRIMLVYTDPPAVVGSQSPQVNDLSLSVDHNTSRYWGNDFAGAWSSPAASADSIAERDSLNNSEAVYLPAGTSGRLEISVTGFNIAGDGVPGFGDRTDQDFAFVCTNCRAEPGFEITFEPATVDACILGGSVSGQLTLEPIGGMSDAVTLTLANRDELPAGSQFTFDDSTITPPGSTTWRFNQLVSDMAGDYKIEIVGTAGELVKQGSLPVRLRNPIIGGITLQTPANGAADISVLPTLSWVGPSDIDYRLEVATDPEFNDIAYTTILFGNEHLIDSKLQRATTYYWRVVALNPCQNITSSVGSFTTVERLPVLLVDDSQSIFTALFGVPTVSFLYSNALETLNVAYDFWDVNAQQADPSAEKMREYESLIWFTGDNPAGPEAGATDNVIGGFLEDGGCFMLSSREYFSSIGLTGFMQTYMGISGGTSDAGYPSVSGTGPLYGNIAVQTLNPASDFVFYVSSPDLLEPNDNGTTIFTTDEGGVAGVTQESDNYISTFLGFELESFEPDAMADTLATYLNRCRAVGGLAPTADPDHHPNTDCDPYAKRNPNRPGPSGNPGPHSVTDPNRHPSAAGPGRIF